MSGMGDVPSVPNRAQALERLADLTAHIANLRIQLADTLIAEHTARCETWVNSSAESVSGRDRIADINVSALHNDVTQLTGQIKALEDEREFLNLCVHWNGTMHIAPKAESS